MMKNLYSAMNLVSDAMQPKRVQYEPDTIVTTKAFTMKQKRTDPSSWGNEAIEVPLNNSQIGRFELPSDMTTFSKQDGVVVAQVLYCLILIIPAVSSLHQSLMFYCCLSVCTLSLPSFSFSFPRLSAALFVYQGSFLPSFPPSFPFSFLFTISHSFYSYNSPLSSLIKTCLSI